MDVLISEFFKCKNSVQKSVYAQEVNFKYLHLKRSILQVLLLLNNTVYMYDYLLLPVILFAVEKFYYFMLFLLKNFQEENFRNCLAS